jgi:hypothetical protein
LVNGRCYFSSRTSRSIRIITLEDQFPVTTLPVDFNTLLPTVDIDFNRIIVTPSGDSILLFDRKGPYIVLVSLVLTSHPVISILHTPGSGLKTPLQGACYPILPQNSLNWDCPLPMIPLSAASRKNIEDSSQIAEINLSLEISTDLCFVAAGSNLWAVPTRGELAITLPIDQLPEKNLDLQDVGPLNPLLAMNTKTIQVEDDDEESNNQLADPSYAPYLESLAAIRTPTLPLCDMAHVYSKFLVHDIISVTSNSLLVLNRHRINTGLYLLTASAWSHCHDEASFHDSYALHYLVGSDYIAPHGMTISLDRKQIVIVETGSKEESGARGGYINLMELHLCVDKKTVRVSDPRKLEEILVTEIDNLFEKIQLGKEMVTGRGSMSYETVYNMDGDEYEELTPMKGHGKGGGLGCCRIV